jgi:hypothetical protein
MHVDRVVQSLWRLWAGEGDHVSRWALVIDGLSTAFGDYVSIDIETGLFTFVSVDRLDRVTPESAWASPLRQPIKPAKLMRVILAERILNELTDADFEAFATRVKAYVNLNGIRVQEVSGEDIRYWYDKRNMVERDQGSLTSSCIGKASTLPWLDIFTENPEQVSMVIGVTHDAKLAARSLLWLATDGKRYYDRPYGRTEARDKVEQYMRDNGYQETGSCWGYAKKLYVRLDNPFHPHYPSLDTFRCLDPDTGLFTQGYGGYEQYRDISDTTGGTNMSHLMHKNRSAIELAASELAHAHDVALYEAANL